MSTQIEHLENHSARLTVEVGADRVDKAMREAAHRISRQVNIPGFRKGKAPYNVVLQRFGTGAVLEEALEKLGNEVYREALEEAKIEPYAPGNLENVETEPQMKLTFVVPKQPEVDLSNYREIRLPFEVPEVEDSAVTDTMKAMQNREALVELVTRPAQMTDEVKLHVKGEQVHPADEREHDHDHEEAEQAQSGSESNVETKAEEETDSAPETFTTPYIDDEITTVLTENEEEEDFLPGFSAHIVGMSSGEKKSFSLAYPEGYKLEPLARHAFNFEVEVKEVKSRTLPALNDEFAKRVTNNEIDNLLDLRIRIRKDLQEAQKREAESKYADEMLDKVIEQATIKYPEEMVNEYIDDILQSLDRNLRERGLSLDHYKRIENKDDAALRADYREVAIKRLQRALTLGELVNREKITVSDSDIDSQIDKMSQQFGEQAQIFRQMLNRAENRRSVAMDMITNRALHRLVEIGRGENPPVESAISEVVKTAAESQQPAESTAPITTELAEPAAAAPVAREPSAETPTAEATEVLPEVAPETLSETPSEAPTESSAETSSGQPE